MKFAEFFNQSVTWGDVLSIAIAFVIMSGLSAIGRAITKNW